MRINDYWRLFNDAIAEQQREEYWEAAWKFWARGK